MDNEALFYEYLNNNLVPYYALMKENQTGAMKNHTTWLNPKGILSAEVYDLDQDDDLEMLVFYSKQNTANRYIMYLEVYEVKGGKVLLAAKREWFPYGEKSGRLAISTSEQPNRNINVSVITKGEHCYIVCEDYSNGGYFSDGWVDANYWAVEYSDEKIKDIFSCVTMGSENAYDAIDIMIVGYELSDGGYKRQNHIIFMDKR